jgi:hypothetical protein
VDSALEIEFITSMPLDGSMNIVEEENSLHYKYETEIRASYGNEKNLANNIYDEALELYKQMAEDYIGAADCVIHNLTNDSVLDEYSSSPHLHMRSSPTRFISPTKSDMILANQYNNDFDLNDDLKISLKSCSPTTHTPLRNSESDIVRIHSHEDGESDKVFTGEFIEFPSPNKRQALALSENSPPTVSNILNQILPLEKEFNKNVSLIESKYEETVWSSTEGDVHSNSDDDDYDHATLKNWRDAFSCKVSDKIDAINDSILSSFNHSFEKGAANFIKEELGNTNVSRGKERNRMHHSFKKWNDHARGITSILLLNKKDPCIDIGSLSNMQGKIKSRVSLHINLYI